MGAELSAERALELGSPADTPTCSSMGLQMELSEMLQLENEERFDVPALAHRRIRSLVRESDDLSSAFQPRPREPTVTNTAWMQLGGSAI
mmetsp:Transcript_4161/g.11312  ORF Transcript_4161/g.11312 Transcript_4161/m.11312 type:complete len:90 (+) Transcript_4161:73-342(+)